MLSFKTALMTLVAGVAIGVQVNAAEVITEQDVQMCYENAGKNAAKQQACVKKELNFVKAYYKDVYERTILVAKRRDKVNKNKEGWDKFIRSGQNFDAYVKNECTFAKLMAKGGKAEKELAQDVCQIGLYRQRSQNLENKYLR